MLSENADSTTVLLSIILTKIGSS